MEFKIGDKVEFGINGIPEGQGEILALAYDYPICKSWIVLITHRNTEFLKNKPEKAIIIFEKQMKIINQ